MNSARQSGLVISIRGGGHNVAGRSVTDGGLMIDLSAMKGIHVDPAARTVRAQGGVTWGELNRETQLHGLAITGGAVSTTGIAGLTLGGGLGWLMAKHGLAVDNLLSVDLVTADGSVLTASADEHADLFWALRGGGGNFGVVTWFEYRLHPVGPTVTGGFVVHPVEPPATCCGSTARSAAACPTSSRLRRRSCTRPTAPASRSLRCSWVTAARPSRPSGTSTRSWRSGSPLDGHVGPMPYETMNTLIDDAFPKGALNYWKSSFLAELTDDAIDALVECFASCPPPMSHGRAGGCPRRGDTRRPSSDTATPHRNAGYNLVLYGVWLDPAATDQEHRLDARQLRGNATVPVRASLRQLPRRRRDGDDPIRPRTARTTTGSSTVKTHVRPGQRLPPQPEHPAALATVRGQR